MTKWFEIWNQKKIDKSKVNDNTSLFLAMKEANGFDVVEGAFTYEGFLLQFNELLDEIKRYEEANGKCVETVYEVGCGSGANLFLLKNIGYEIGGSDYSKSLLNEAISYLGKGESDLECIEAINIKEFPKYDVVMSNGVFGYFPSYNYAEKTLEKMVNKTNGIIALIDIHDKKQEENYYHFRKKTIPNFEEVYEGLDKLFYPKEFFEEFAKKNNLGLKFVKTEIKEYWNNEFVYSCYMYK